MNQLGTSLFLRHDNILFRNLYVYIQTFAFFTTDDVDVDA